MKRTDREAVVVAALRTPVGRYAGALASIRPDDLAALVIKTVVERTGVDPTIIDDVYLGAANQAGEDNRDVARMAALLAGLPSTVPGATVNRLCASGLEAINIAARMIETGHGDVMIAGGVESMTRAPFVFAKQEAAWDRRPPEVFDTTIGWRFTNPALAAMHHPYSMGETAENVARKWGIPREEQDRFSYQSQQRWKAAQEAGRWAEEIIPVTIPQRKGDPIIFETDEHPRPDTPLEKLSTLRPVFAKDDLGTVTAGNSSGVNDGAAALLIVERRMAERHGLTPLVRIGASASAGVDPAYMGVGPVFAVRKAIEREGVDLANIDLIELNEAFAAQSLACIRDLDLDEERVNVNGGAIAIGHPLGCSGARITTTLIHEMRRRSAKRGIATACIGVGQGLATVFELID
ncbi:MAG: thiolase family protein [Phycisphaerales bacterium]|nr:MAG: thiolase family protein [Phycisphaerales bacterium]